MGGNWERVGIGNGWEWVGMSMKCWVLEVCWAVVELAGGMVTVWLGDLLLWRRKCT
jgi:hypothetical protein